MRVIATGVANGLRFVALIAFALPSVGSAIERAAPTLRAVRARDVPVVDGFLDDAPWNSAPRLTEFTQRSPHDGAPPTEMTEVLVLVADDAVFIGARLRESRADVSARLTTRDREVDSDWLMVDIDSRHDRTTAYSFRVNAAGVQYDGIRYDDDKLDTDWDAIWTSAVRVDADGWTVEMRIPTSVLRYSDHPGVWGIQFTRYLSRLHETSVWAYSPAAVRGYVSRFGTLSGLDHLRTSRHLELRPFAFVRSTSPAPRAGALFRLGSGTEFNAGLDAKLGLSSRFTFDAAVNPDFGEIESDQVILNLTRLEAYLPDKRPFFSEGVDVFTTPIQMFYSRRVGGERTGDSAAPPPRIWAAGKLVGHVTSGLSLGVLEAVTGSEDVDVANGDGTWRRMAAAPPTSYLVARVRYDAGSASYLGATATALTRIRAAGRADLDHDSYVQGIDGQWQNASSTLRMTGHFVLSERVGGGAYQDARGAPCTASVAAPGCVPLVRPDGTRLRPGDIGVGGFVSASYQGSHWFGDASYRGYAPTLDLGDLGFLTDFNQHIYDLGAGYEERGGAGVVRRYRFRLGARGRYQWDNVGIGSIETLDVRIEYTNFFVQTLQLSLRMPGSWEPYETGDGARLERHGLFGLKLGVESDARRAVSVVGEVLGRIDPGSGEANWSVSTALEVKPIPRLQFELRADAGGDHGYMRKIDCRDERGAVCSPDSVTRQYRFADLSDTSLSLTGRLTYTFTNQLSIQAYAQKFVDGGQYDHFRSVVTSGAHPFIRFSDLADADASDHDFRDSALNANAVLRWEFRAGSTLLVIFGRRQALGAGPLHHMTVKVTYFL